MRTQKHLSYETSVVEVFCRAVGNLHLVRPLDQGPDYLLQLGDQQLGLELTRYRQQGPENEAFEQDWAFQEFVLDRWLYDEYASHFTPIIDYRRDHADRFLIPKPLQRERFVQELRELVRQVKPPGEHQLVEVIICHDSQFAIEQKRADISKRNGSRPRQIMDQRMFPVVAAHCASVKFMHHPRVRMGRPLTLNATRVSIDEKEITSLVQSKLVKLARYRQAVQSPIWLLLHSDGWPPASRIPDLNILLRKAYDTVLAVLTGWEGDLFDRVYWMNDTFSGSGTRVVRLR